MKQSSVAHSVQNFALMCYRRKLYIYVFCYLYHVLYVHICMTLTVYNVKYTCTPISPLPPFSIEMSEDKFVHRKLAQPNPMEHCSGTESLTKSSLSWSKI